MRQLLVDHTYFYCKLSWQGDYVNLCAIHAANVMAFLSMAYVNPIVPYLFLKKVLIFTHEINDIFCSSILWELQLNVDQHLPPAYVSNLISIANIRTVIFADVDAEYYRHRMSATGFLLYVKNIGIMANLSRRSITINALTWPFLFMRNAMY